MIGMVPEARGETTKNFEEYFSQYETVYDVVEAGADNTGRESITPILREYADDDTLLVFPPGRYYMDEQFRFTGFRNFGLLGNDATLVPADYHHFDGPQYRLFRLGVYYNPGRDLLFEGFTVDQTAPDTGIRVIEAFVHDGLQVRDVTVDGVHDSGTWGPGFFSVTDPDGFGIVERFRAPDGGTWVDDTPNAGNLWRGPSGFISSRYHEGTIEYRDCELGGFPDNGLYAVTSGTVKVIGGTFKNSHAANVRLGGDGSIVRGASIVVDENPEHFTNQRGIRLDSGGNLSIDGVTIRLDKPNGTAISVLNDVDSARIEDTRLLIGDTECHGIVINEHAGDVDIIDTDIDINGSANAIQINGTDAGAVVCQWINITGTASGGTWRHAIRCNRNNCEFRILDVEQPGSDYRRALVINGDDCLVYRAEFSTTHHPIVVNGANAWIEDCYLESYRDYEAIRLNDRSSNAKVKQNVLVNGVLDKGCEGLSMYGNTIG